MCLTSTPVPLHFTLMFLYGTKGWDMETTHANSRRQVTPREFFEYHTQVRHRDSDYLFRAGRLFQEWLCMAWVTAEPEPEAGLQRNTRLS